MELKIHVASLVVLALTGCSTSRPIAIGLVQSDGGPPPLPPLQNVTVTMHGDTATVAFEPILGALDYRIYPRPNDSDNWIGSNGQLVVRNAIYRCAGDQPLPARDDDASGQFNLSLSNNIHNYARSDIDNILGYVYLTPGDGRQAVYRVSNPNQNGGYAWPTEVPPAREFDSADYVVETAARDAYVSSGWRDDGIVFYAPDGGTKVLNRREYVPDGDNNRTTVFYTDGPEADARSHDDPNTIAADGPARFHLLDHLVDDAVPLHRVYYGYANGHDVLAPGEERFQRVLHQGNRPVKSVTWPGLTATTTLVVEALDAGCPFPNGYIGTEHRASAVVQTVTNSPTLTLDEARLPSGEVFLNGQHDPANRPRPIARTYVVATPETSPLADWNQTFDTGAPWDPFVPRSHNNIGDFIYGNSIFSAEFMACTTEPTMGPLLGQFVVGGDSCNGYFAVRDVRPTIGSDHYVHVRMSVEIPSTSQRYPQLLLTTVPIVAPVPGTPDTQVPIIRRLGPVPFQQLPPGTEHTLIVQPFGRHNELQIQFCDQRGWGVTAQCPRANLYGYPVDGPGETWQSPWNPNPLLGDLAGFDRPVRFDVYASTDHVYVFLDGRPGGCAVLPAGRMPSGPLTVVFGIAASVIAYDNNIVTEDSPNRYLREFSRAHQDRHFDDLGIEQNGILPPWNETELPCGTRWYGES